MRSTDHGNDLLLNVKNAVVCFVCRRPADFVLLMCASQQWKVFDCEKTEEWMVLAGENTDEPDPMEGRLFNPAPNFINCRSIISALGVASCVDSAESTKLLSHCQPVIVKIFSPSSGSSSSGPGVTWTWPKCLCSVTSSGWCCQWSSSLAPPGSPCLASDTCWPASSFCSLAPNSWSSRPGPASTSGTASSCTTWESSYRKTCCL